MMRTGSSRRLGASTPAFCVIACDLWTFSELRLVVTVAIGNASVANTLRVAMKRRLNHPLSISFGSGTAAAAASGAAGRLLDAKDTVASVVAALPPALTMQTLRANDANGTELLLRIAHSFALDSAAAASMALPQSLNLHALLQSAGLAHQVVAEVTLTGLATMQSSVLDRQRWEANGTVLPEGAWVPGTRGETNGVADNTVGAADGRDGAVVTIRPLEIRAWLLRLPAESRKPIGVKTDDYLSSAAPTHLEIMTFYDFNASAQHGWAVGTFYPEHLTEWRSAWYLPKQHQSFTPDFISSKVASNFIGAGTSGRCAGCGTWSISSLTERNFGTVPASQLPTGAVEFVRAGRPLWPGCCSSSSRTLLAVP